MYGKRRWNRMGLLYKLDGILNVLEEVRDGQNELRRVVEGLLERPGGRDRIQEGVENILRYSGPKGGERD